MVRDLTLKQFKEFALENVFSNFNFQYSEEYYRERLNDEELETMFSYEIRNRLNAKTYPNLVFRFGLKHEDIDEISSYHAEAFFRDFVDNSDLQDLENTHVSFDYYSTQDYEFELTLCIWVDEKRSYT